MRTLFRIVLWNVVFAATLAAVVFIFAVWVEYYVPRIGRGIADAIGLALPGLFALWVLFLGSRYASSRLAVTGCAVGAGLLVAAQSALLGILLAYSKGFGGRTDATALFEILIPVTVISGIVLIWRFVAAKRPSPPKA